MQLASRKKKTWRLAIPGLMATVLLTAACGSDDEGNGATTGADDSQAADDAAAAAKTMETLSQPPADITLTDADALAEAPPKGTMIWMLCDVPACEVIGDGVKAGVEAAGWTFETEGYLSADPATLTAALKRALAKSPDAVSLSGIPPEAGWSSVIPDYEAAGVPIIPNFLGPTDLGDTVVANPGGPPARYADGVNMAHWFIADSEGKGKALLQRLDGFPILKEWADGFQKTVEAECAACELKPLENTIADAVGGKIPSTIVPALKSDPSLTYLISSDLEFSDALVAQMKAAGLEDIIVAGATPTVVGQQAVKDGTWAAFTPAGFSYAGWLTADAAFRTVMGLPIPEAVNGPMPTQVLTTESDFEIAPSFEQPADYPEQFKAIWKVG